MLEVPAVEPDELESLPCEFPEELLQAAMVEAVNSAARMRDSVFVRFICFSSFKY